MNLRQTVNKAAIEKGYIIKVYLDTFLLIKKENAKDYPIPALVFNNLIDIQAWLEK